MIHVTKLNGKKFVINALHIEHVEETPDTLITLTTGKKYIVQQSAEEIITQTKNFYRDISLLHGVVKSQESKEDY